MNKNKIILSAIGGTALLAALVLGYLLFSASGDKSMMAEDLEAAKSSVQNINNAKIQRSEASVSAIVSNRTLLVDWREAALAIASGGDFKVDPSVTPEAFKRTMVDDARELAKLPGGLAGRLVKDDFAFGFPDFITGGSIPDPASVPALQRQWREVKLFVGLLAECGVVELKGVQVVVKKAEAPAEEAAPKKKGKKKAAAEAEADPVTEQAYELKFLARPPALVKVLNALATAERFVAVDSFSFARERDALQELIGESKEKEQGGARSARRGRRRPGAEAAEENAAEAVAAEANKKGLVTDPELDLPFAVTLSLTTFDFGVGGAGEAAPAAEQDSKEEEE